MATVLESFGSWARYFVAPIRNSWSVFLEAVRNGIFDTLRWEDLRFPMTGNRLDSSSTRYSYDFTYCGIRFHTNARYPNEPICALAQYPHGWAEGQDSRPHIHWWQQEANDPNWLLAYTKVKNGEAIGSEVLVIPSTQRTFTYPGSPIVQITKFPDIDMSDMTISDSIAFRLFRDTGNISGLFPGSDIYSQNALVWEFDAHYEVDSTGSYEEYVK